MGFEGDPDPISGSASCRSGSGEFVGEDQVEEGFAGKREDRMMGSDHRTGVVTAGS